MKVFKEFNIDLKAEKEIEKPSPFDTYIKSSMGRMKFRKGVWREGLVHCRMQLMRMLMILQHQTSLSILILLILMSLQMLTQVHVSAPSMIALTRFKLV